MASINKVILVGNLGQDPEVKYMPSGGAVTNLSIATTDSWKDKSTGEKREYGVASRCIFQSFSRNRRRVLTQRVSSVHRR